MVIALLIVLIVLVLTRGGDDEGAAPSTTEAAASTTVASTDAPETTAATTVAATEAPTSTVPETTVADTTPVTEPPVLPLSVGQATIVADGTTSRYTIAVTCTDFWAGVEQTSHVLVDDASGGVWVATVFRGEEGGPRGLAMADMQSAIASDLYGQDTSFRSPTYFGDIDEGPDGVARSTVTLSLGDGAATVDVAIAEPVASSDCSTGSFSQSSPFPVGTPVEWTSSDDTFGTRFNVLAQCGGELLLTGGALLVSNEPVEGSTLGAFLSNAYVLTGEDVFWSNTNDPQPQETFYEQSGGGGDVLAAINVFREGDRAVEPGYLQWTERPLRSAVGDAGLLDEVCPGP
jgi:hypothetical protein